MIKIVCDRCGGEIVRNLGEYGYHYEHVRDGLELAGSFDLCNDCGKKLELFLNNKEVTND